MLILKDVMVINIVIFMISVSAWFVCKCVLMLSDVVVFKVVEYFMKFSKV